MKDSYIDVYLSREAPKYEESELYDIYDSIPNANLRRILSSLHSQLNHWFTVINGDLRTSYDEEGNKVYSGGYFHAQDSRDLLAVLDDLDKLKRKLLSTQYEFVLINASYDNAIRRCKRFLLNRNGSTIPEDFKPIEIEDVEPIFQIKNSISIQTEAQTVYAALDSVGKALMPVYLFTKNRHIKSKLRLNEQSWIWMAKSWSDFVKSSRCLNL